MNTEYKVEDIIDYEGGVDIFGDEDIFNMGLENFSESLTDNIKSLHAAFKLKDQHKMTQASHK